MGRVLILAAAASVLVTALGCSCGNVHYPTPLDGGPDAPPPQPASVDPRGTWLGCSRTWIFEDGGTVTRIDHWNECTAVGSWEADGTTLQVTWTAPCAGMGLANTFDATRSSGRLVLVDRGSGSFSPLMAEGALVRVYTIVDDANPTLRTVVRMVGEPGTGGGWGCYWSEDRDCGGLFSCSGNVEQWPAGPGDVVASTSCTGGCPCASILHVTPSDDGTLAIRYDGVNCSYRFEGTATATPRAE